MVHFVAQIVSGWSHGEVLPIGSCVLWMCLHHFLTTLSGIIWYSRLIFYFPYLASYRQKNGFSPGILDACVIVAILVKRKKNWERKESGISLIFLQCARPSFYFPVLWLEMGSSQSSAINGVLCLVLEFSLPSFFKSMKGRRENIILNSHLPNPQFYRDCDSSFYFSP